MHQRTLDDLLSALDVRLKAFALCEIGSDWRLCVDALETVMCHFVLRGHGYIEFADRRVPIAAGAIVLVPPGIEKSFSGPDAVRREVRASDSCHSTADELRVFRARSEDASLVLGCATLTATCGGSLELFTALPEPLFASLSGNALFASCFDALVQELTEPNIGAMVVAECLLKQSLVLLLRDGGNDPGLLDHLGDERIVRAAAAMIKAPSEQHDIESLARISGMSRSSFMAYFVRNYCKTPGEYLQAVRMHAAARLLETSATPIKRVAAQVGYASRSQFSRAFRLAFQADPSSYRAQHLPTPPPRIAAMELDKDVFITEELASRPIKFEDLRRQKVALQELAQRMSDDPADLLPRFVELAMQLTDAASAGLSIFNSELVPRVFEWRCLHGVLAPFDRVTTPRDYSPCGVTLDVNQPMLLRHPERIYDWIAAANLIIPEVLLVPLTVAGEPLGTLWVVSRDEEHFAQGDARVLSELANFVGIAVKMERANRDLGMGPEGQQTSARETSHPVENPLRQATAMVQIATREAEKPAGIRAASAQRPHPRRSPRAAAAVS